jgi:hypothetical protein
MMSNLPNLEALAYRPTRRHAIVGVATAFGGLAMCLAEGWAGTEDEPSRIHILSIDKAFTHDSLIDSADDQNFPTWRRSSQRAPAFQ